MLTASAEKRTKKKQASNFRVSKVMTETLSVFNDLFQSSKSNGRPDIEQAKAVLSTLTDIIQKRKLSLAAAPMQLSDMPPPTSTDMPPPTSTDYLGTILLGMTQVKESEKVLGMLILLEALLPVIRVPVMQAKFGLISQKLVQLLAAQAEAEDVVKAVLRVSQSLLQGRDASLWVIDGPALKLTQGVLSFSLDPRPAVRTSAKKAIKQVLYDLLLSSGRQQLPKPLCDLILSFVQHEVSNCTEKDLESAMLLCGLLQNILGLLPVPTTATIMNDTMGLVPANTTRVGLTGRASQAMLFIQICHVLKALANSDRHTDLQVLFRDGDSDVKLTALLHKFLTYLESRTPHPSDVPGFNAYSQAAVACAARLYRINALQEELLPHWFGRLTQGLLAEKTEIVQAAASSLETLLLRAISSLWLSHSLKLHQASSSSSSTTTTTTSSSSAVDPLSQLLRLAQSLLDFRYRNVWLHCFNLLAVLLNALTPECTAAVTPLLKAMDSLLRSQNVLHSTILQNALAVGIASLSPEHFFSVLPFHLPLTPNDSPLPERLMRSRDWVLPFLPKQVKRCALPKLSYFVDAIVPQLQNLESYYTAEYKKDPTSAAAQTLRNLLLQLWEAFPSFCHGPLDTSDAWQGLAKHLSLLLKAGVTSDQVLSQLCRGLTALISTHQAIISPDITMEDEEGGAAGGGPDAGEKRFRNRARSEVSQTSSTSSSVSSRRQGGKKRKGKMRPRQPSSMSVESEVASNVSSRQGSQASRSSKSSMGMSLLMSKKIKRKGQTITQWRAGLGQSDQRSKAGSVVVPPPHTGEGLALATAVSNLSLIASYTPDLLPKLLNLLQTSTQTEALLSAAGCLLSITPANVWQKHYIDAVKLLLKACAKRNDTGSTEAEHDAAKKQAGLLLDVLDVMCPHLDQTSLSTLWRAMSPLLTDKDATLQKRAYRLFATLSSAHSEFLASRWRDSVALIR
eukprot:g50429.t1